MLARFFNALSIPIEYVFYAMERCCDPGFVADLQQDLHVSLLVAMSFLDNLCC